MVLQCVCVCMCALGSESSPVVEGKGLKFSWICLLLILRQMCLARLFSRSPPRSSVYFPKKKCSLKSCYHSWNVHNCRVKGFRIQFPQRKMNEREKSENGIRLCRRCTKTQIHLLCKHLMHHCYVSCCLRMLSSCNIISPMNKVTRSNYAFFAIHFPTFPRWLSPANLS